MDENLEVEKFGLQEALKNKPGTITLISYYIHDMQGSRLFTDLQGAFQTDHFFIDYGGSITNQRLRELRESAVKNNESIILATPVLYNPYLGPEYFPATTRLANEVDFFYHLYNDEKDNKLKLKINKARGHLIEKDQSEI